MTSSSFLDADIEFLKGVGPRRGEVLRQDLGVKTPRDLLYLYPFRYIDKTNFQSTRDVRADGDVVLLKGKIISIEKIKGKAYKSRLTALLKDGEGFIELVWFQGVKFIESMLQEGKEYIVYGRVNVYGGKKSLAHPELEEFTTDVEFHKALDPVYPSSEKLDGLGLDSKGRRRLLKAIFEKVTPEDVPENLPDYLRDQLKFPNRYQTLQWIHFPKDEHQKTIAQNRLKFEEFFFLQLQLIHKRAGRKQLLKGAKFETIGEKFNRFYKEKLPFELTQAQKRVLKEIRADLGAGFQMNRLLQGDVGSGKTIVALMTMLMAIDNGYQASLMAPTEILATQHFESISAMVEGLGIRVAYLSGSVKGKKRKDTLALLADGHIDILIGTHALIEEKVVFHRMGLSIIDEQHRFGVAQRASLWRKSDQVAPHILVMTATPIPRTLALTMYGDLDVSIIDELPVGRKEIKTIHKYETARPQVIAFMHAEIAKGRQIYVVFPLIEESENFDLKDLMAGYEMLLQYFPQPDYQISVVHGRMKPADKDFEMKRFVEKKAQLMVATTVIEVGVNVPNASVMVIENAERFGLSQLHQLRGRVGRGADQSYCILMSGNKLSADARKRIGTMVKTTNGFEIAAVDMELRGPGEMDGTRQSGVNQFKLLNLSKDIPVIDAARKWAELVLEEDPELSLPKNVRLYNYLRFISRTDGDWRRIS
ncbi:MAG: ATP-dependent DNA helicase RecG [Saprospiraceae bacterium]|nr:ATP-dependent DNA helicase RecG [Saprospiraceae bacterium]